MIAGPNLRRAIATAFLIGMAAPDTGFGQALSPSVYVLNVPVASAEGHWAPSSTSHLSRVRLMVDPSFGALRLDIAYEHRVHVRLQGNLGVGGLVLGSSGGGGDWLPLQGTVFEQGRVTWRHRMDRLAVSWTSEFVEVTAGRQTISWATTIMLTPADPFQPFDPTDPFRTYRGGVDAVRVRMFPGPFSSIEAVGRVTDTSAGTTGSLLARWTSDWGRFGTAAWAGVLHNRAAASVGLTVTTGGAMLRGEASIRQTRADPVWRVAVGIDRSFQVAGRTLYALVEYQHDGFGATSPLNRSGVLMSEPGRRGELQALGQDVAAVNVSYAIHPLVSVDMLSLVNLRDPSVLAAPAITWSVGHETTLRLGGYVGAGTVTQTTNSAGPIPGSEFGPVPLIGYGALEVFF